MASGDSLQAATNTSTIAATSGVSLTTKTHDTAGSIVKQFIGSGTDGNDYEIECTVTTSQGRVGQREIIIEVRETP